uniref:Uncharacterized protein n=1 Tax=Arundo donax TaxID=35708 RepID=A0A0A9EJC1_ARUDO
MGQFEHHPYVTWPVLLYIRSKNNLSVTKVLSLHIRSGSEKKSGRLKA